MQEEYTEEDLYYHLRAVARLLDLSQRTILKYERLGLIQCEEIVVEGRIRHRCYTPDTLDRLRKIRWLTMDLGVNLAGVEVILELLDRLDETR